MNGGGGGGAGGVGMIGRMTDYLEVIKQEHDQMARECESLKAQRDEYEARGE